MKDKIRAAFHEIRADDAIRYNTAAYLNRELQNRRRVNKGFIFTKRAGALTAVAAAVLIGVLFSYGLYFTAYAYVSIDVNPSVELTLNRFDKVIGAYAFNKDGERVLNGVKLRGERYDEAAGLIISRIEADGYFADAALVSVTVQADSGEREQTLCTALRRVLDERILQKAAGVEVFPVSAETRGNAHSCNVSPAKYLALQELLEVDEEATITDYGDSDIGTIRRRAQECRNAHGAAGTAGPDSPSAGMGGHMHGGHGGHH